MKPKKPEMSDEEIKEIEAKYAEAIKRFKERAPRKKREGAPDISSVEPPPNNNKGKL